MKKIIASLAFAALATPAFAHGVSQPSLLGALVNLGNHGGIASVGANVASPNALADVKANVLDFDPPGHWTHPGFYDGDGGFGGSFCVNGSNASFCLGGHN